MTPTQPQLDLADRPYGASVVNGELLVELAAREAGRRKHQNWKRVSAMDLIEVLKELGFKMVVTP
jgi:hypothetical protein